LVPLYPLGFPEVYYFPATLIAGLFRSPDAGLDPAVTLCPLECSSTRQPLGCPNSLLTFFLGFVAALHDDSSLWRPPRPRRLLISFTSIVSFPSSPRRGTFTLVRLGVLKRALLVEHLSFVSRWCPTPLSLVTVRPFERDPF